MAITRSATARYDGTGKDGKGSLTTQSGVLQDQRYGFQSRFEDGPGTNPEELIAAAHAGCFTMALSFGLAREGITDARLETTARVKLEQDGEGFTVTRSDLTLTADVPDLGEDEGPCACRGGGEELPDLQAAEGRDRADGEHRGPGRRLRLFDESLDRGVECRGLVEHHEMPGVADPDDAELGQRRILALVESERALLAKTAVAPRHDQRDGRGDAA